MLQNRFSTVLLGLLAGVAWAAAQVNVTLQLPFQQMPARIAEWRENESLIRIVVQNSGRERYDGLMLSVELSKDGRRIARSRDGHPAQPRWSLGPGETRSLSWREVIAEEAIEYDGAIRQQVIATGELPEGQYRLCIQVLSAQMRPISPRPCASFVIVLADPPRLLRPIGGAQLPTPMPLLEWTPSTPPAPGLQYRVTVKVRYRGQTPAQAMASNPVRLQVDVPATSYQVGRGDQLGIDVADPNYAGHVWQVQALLNGRPYGRNQGLSQIEWFLVPAIAVDTVKPGDGRPIAVLEWELPYDALSTGRPISLQVPPIEEDTVLYVLRVRVPEQLSHDQLQQLMKNWAHDVRKEISTARMSQDTFVVQGRYIGGYFLYRAPQDTLGVDYVWPRYTGGFFLYRAPQDTLGVQQDTFGVARRRRVGRYIGERIRHFAGGYFLYSLPQDTTQPARLAGWVGRRDPVIIGLPQDTTVPTPPPPPARITIRPLSDRVLVEPAPAEERRGNVLVVGHFTPTHVALPMPELEIDPGEGPVCGLPVPEEEQPSAEGVQARQKYYYHGGYMWPVGGGYVLATGSSLNPQPPPPGTDGGPRYTGYVLNQAIASGAGRPTGKTLGAVTRQAPPGGSGNQGQAIRQQLADLGAEVEVHRMAGPISLPRPSDVGIPEFRMAEGGMPVLWPNGNPPSNPEWPVVGVIGIPVLDGIEGEGAGPGKPQNWCGTEYVWTGPRPKSPKLILNVIGPWSNPPKK